VAASFANRFFSNRYFKLTSSRLLYKLRGANGITRC